MTDLLWQDGEVAIGLPEQPANAGHVIIYPVQPHNILEQVPDDVLQKMMLTANKISVVLFEALQVHGTNIIIQNGVPAGQTLPVVSINVIPRKEGDNIDLDWKPQQIPKEQLDKMFNDLKPFADNVKLGEPLQVDEKKQPVQEQPVESIDPDQDNYLLKQLDRIP